MAREGVRLPYRIHTAVGTGSLLASRCVVATRGEPSAVQIFSYAWEDRLGRNGRMNPYTIAARAGHGTSTTRPSIRKSRRYVRTSGTAKESGDPVLMSRIPVMFEIVR